MKSSGSIESSNAFGLFNWSIGMVSHRVRINKIQQSDKLKPKGDLPVDVRPEILPITKRENLMNCLHGKTQNTNECSMG